MSRNLELSIIDREKCIHMLDDIEHQEYVTDDKLCGGYLNKSKFVIARTFPV